MQAANDHTQRYTIEAIPAFNDNYIWMISDSTTKAAYAVDPGDATPVLSRLKERNLMLAGILITHHHFDHVGGIDALLAALDYDIPIYGPNNPNIKQITHPLHEGEQISLEPLQLTFTVFEVPGHTLDHIAYYTDALQGVLFCGDTLFSAGCGRLFEGTPQQMLESLNKFKQLPGHTNVYCTHEYTLANLAFAAAVEPNNQAIAETLSACTQKREANEPTLPSTIEKERAINPFLRTDQPTVRQQAQQQVSTLSDQAEEHEVFAAIRTWKDQF